ncbi:uncharacterized protein LOC34622034 [Cyclospora cayetanensis]|uniref:Uncharacterized protein LOC34622034 n=1 Tax=Cyclospora cayetanensis TaxID=88456 RepID=A0A6P6RS19_9EIME|nr:uncharacterized protein LOC34622034 [Cyclospora cayetanensis]
MGATAAAGARKASEVGPLLPSPSPHQSKAVQQNAKHPSPFMRITGLAKPHDQAAAAAHHPSAPAGRGILSPGAAGAATADASPSIQSQEGISGVREIASPTAVDASAATSLPVVNSGSSDIYDDPGTSQPMSERSKQWLAYDKEHGTLWGRDWLYYRLLQQRLPPSISLLQAAAGVRRVSREMLQQRKTLNSCRSHVASRRSLRPDGDLDRIVRRLFPSLRAFEEKHHVLLSRANQRLHSNQGAAAEHAAAAAACAAAAATCTTTPAAGAPETASAACGLPPHKRQLPQGALVSPLQLQQHPKKHGSILNTSSSSKAYALLLLRPPTPPPFVDASGQLVPRQQQQQSHGRPPSLCAADAAGFAVAGSTHSRYLTMAMQAALPPPERKRLRRELSLLLRRHQASTAAAAEGGDSAAAVRLHFELLPDLLMPHLPLLEQNRLSTDGSCTVLQLSRFVAARLNQQQQQKQLLQKQQLQKQLQPIADLRLYTKEHRAPFGPNLTLAALHQLSLAYPTESLVVYYTTRSYNDEGGGVLSGLRGHLTEVSLLVPAESAAASRYLTQQQQQLQSLSGGTPTDRHSSPSPSVSGGGGSRGSAMTHAALSSLGGNAMGTPDGLLAGALGARCALPPESGPTPERQREHAANASSTRASTAMQQHLPAAVLGAARTPQGSAVAVPHPAAAASAGRFGSGAAFKPLDASLPVAAADQVPRRSAAVGMPYRPSGVGAPGTAASSFAAHAWIFVSPRCWWSLASASAFCSYVGGCLARQLAKKLDVVCLHRKATGHGASVTNPDLGTSATKYPYISSRKSSCLRTAGPAASAGCGDAAVANSTDRQMNDVPASMLAGTACKDIEIP